MNFDAIVYKYQEKTYEPTSEEQAKQIQAMTWPLLSL